MRNIETEIKKKNRSERRKDTSSSSASSSPCAERGPVRTPPSQGAHEVPIFSSYLCPKGLGPPRCRSPDKRRSGGTLWTDWPPPRRICGQTSGE